MITKKLFLASSSELKEDRMEFEIFINRKNKDWVARGVFLELVVWEDFLDAVSNTRLQDEYNKAIRECDVFVMLFWTKVGQYTEEEFETAFGQFKATNKPFIFTYFKDAPISTASANKNDLMSLQTFQEKLNALGHFYTVYKNVDELKFKFNQQLDKLAANGFVEFNPNKAQGAPSASQANNTGAQINTGGGAYIGGNVSAGGDVVGRDQSKTVIHQDVSLGDFRQQRFYGTLPIDDRKAEETYRKSIADRCGILPLQSLDVSATGGRAKPLSLAEIYISLDTRQSVPVAHIEAALEKAASGQLEGLSEHEASGREAERERETRPVSALEATIVNPCLVLTGEPGSGKSTFVNHLTHALALRQWECLSGWPNRERNALPVPVTLREFARWVSRRDYKGQLPEASASLLWDYIAHDLTQWQLDSATGVLKKALDDGRALILLDGLDEVPADEETLLNVVKTSVQRFVERYRNNHHLVTCRVLSYQEPHWRLPEPTFPDALELASFDEKKIGRFIDAWYGEVGAKWKLSLDKIDTLTGKLRRAVRRPDLWRLAPNPLLLTVMALLDRVAALHPKASYDWARQLLETLRLRASLLLERTGQVFSFPHRTFQEYLAGVYLARLGSDEFVRQVIELSGDRLAYWREVVLLAVGYLVHSQLRDTGKPRLLAEELCPERGPETDVGWRKVWLAGDVLREIGVNRVRDTDQGKRLLGRVTERLTELLERGDLSARERAEAGDVLGELGDPRFDPDFFHLPCRYRGEPEPLAGFEEIQPGPFVMGSSKGDPDDILDNESGNPDRLTIDYPYWIARYPVTIAQFSAFMDAGGYETQSWWTKTGWEWRQGRWDSQVEEEWLRDRLKSRPAKLRDKPMWWSEQRAVGNRPVVGVSWFEAVAYCRWLDEVLRRSGKVGVLQDGKYILRLATEAEWEKSARAADARRYPWGNEAWDAERANIGDSKIGHPTSVGMYPKGATAATAAALHDVGGNVWEWALSLYRDYPYRAADGCNDPNAAASRVVCGGSWGSSLRRSRCASRHRSHPDGWYDLQGFRVVLSLADSGF